LLFHKHVNHTYKQLFGTFPIKQAIETGLHICTKGDKIRRIILFHGTLVHYEGRWYNTARRTFQTYCYCFRL